MIPFFLFSLFDVYDANNVVIFLLFVVKISLILFLNGADTFRQSNESFSPFVQIDDFYSVLCLLGDYQTSFVVVRCVVEFVQLDLL